MRMRSCAGAVREQRRSSNIDAMVRRGNRLMELVLKRNANDAGDHSAGAIELSIMENLKLKRKKAVRDRR
jgi:hypothetical protein